MEAQELEERIAAFPRWNYRFEFDGGVVTPVARRGQINRHEQRRRYFFDALLSVTGGSLSGHRVLDLGCNAGLWSLHALQAGADYVLGVDVHGPYLEQAQLVFAAKELDRARYRFEQGDVFAHDFGGQRFDVVLCLGVMEVTAKPVELFELFERVGADLLVIDTAISPARSSSLEVTHVDDPHDRVRQSLVLLPTAAAVVELAREFGFTALALAHNMTDYAGMDDYRERRRLAFVASRGGSLAELAGARGQRAQPRWQQALSAAHPQQVRARLRGRR
jgi:SAM-dependent methyltransferase